MMKLKKKRLKQLSAKDVMNVKGAGSGAGTTVEPPQQARAIFLTMDRFSG
ncbi:hypothetical protein L1077_23130 [Pseudoalteromonas luteoviolacea]|nr:hypothetical protein [Pseudoalteromonas luteoviolacea]MCF6442324.1 hypothetical protein [Pseudoalteromonas luteoviolacea]